MNASAFHVLKVIFTGGFLLTLLGGIWLFKNHEKWFGLDPDKPFETSGERTYSKAQAFICWLIALKLFAAMALML